MDGAEVRRRGVFIFVDRATGLAFDDPETGRSLYQLRGRQTYEYCGPTARICGGCGGFAPHAPKGVRRCDFCGGTFEPAER